MNLLVSFDISSVVDFCFMSKIVSQINDCL